MLKRFTPLIVIGAIAPAASAGILSVSPSIDWIAAPADARVDMLTHATRGKAWNEQQYHTLANNLRVDAVASGTYNMDTDFPAVNPFIASGTVISSHYIHFDTPGNDAGTLEGSVTFDYDILGVIARGDGNGGTGLLDRSDFLGTGTLYDDNLDARGLEFNAAGTNDRFTISADRRTVSFKFGVTQPGDRLRVITTVPEPATMAGLGIATLALIRRKRK